MRGSVALPHLVLTGGDLVKEDWSMEYQGTEAQAPSFLGGWDYTKNLTLTRLISMDIEAVSSRLAIPEDDLKLAAVVSVGTGAGTLPRLIQDIERVRFDESGVAMIKVEVDSQHISSRISLSTCIVLAGKPSKSGQMSPVRPGSRLWQDSFEVAVEPLEPRFPLEVISFSRRFPNSVRSRAFWYLHWLDYDPLRDLRGALRLYLNGDDKQFVERIVKMDRLALQMLMSDIVSQICERVLNEPDLDAIDKVAGDGSICSQAMAWLNMSFPGESVEHLRAMSLDQPGEFRSALQAVAEMEV